MIATAMHRGEKEVVTWVNEALLVDKRTVVQVEPESWQIGALMRWLDTNPPVMKLELKTDHYFPPGDIANNLAPALANNTNLTSIRIVQTCPFAFGMDWHAVTLAQLLKTNTNLLELELETSTQGVPPLPANPFFSVSKEFSEDVERAKAEMRESMNRNWMLNEASIDKATKAFSESNAGTESTWLPHEVGRIVTRNIAALSTSKPKRCFWIFRSSGPSRRRLIRSPMNRTTGRSKAERRQQRSRRRGPR
jgi:hypothetical protein